MQYYNKDLYKTGRMAGMLNGEFKGHDFYFARKCKNRKCVFINKKQLSLN